MNRFYSFARTVYGKLPISDSLRTKIRSVLIPGMKKIEVTSSIGRVLDRKSKLLSHISPLSQDGLEIGPLCWPIITKAESNNRIYYIDFSTAEKSREKYKNDPNVNIDEIVETDYLWGKQTMPELVGGKLFDYVVASHVIEHVPNMLGWMREIASVLKDGGILSLAIPDKRYTFDYKRDLTSLGTLVESYLLDKRRPGIRDVFDQVSLATKLDVVKAWQKDFDPVQLEHHQTLEEALVESEKQLASDEYYDVHVNIMTPASFLAILEKATKLGLFDFSVVDFYDTDFNSHEFLVSLQRVSRERSREENLNLQLDSFFHVRNKLN